MIAKHAIEDSIPFLKLTDKVSFALDLMDNLKVSHLAVVKEKKLIGILCEDILLESNSDFNIENLKIPYINEYVNEIDHVFDVMKTGFTTSSIIPVLSIKKEYLGVITPASLITQLEQFSFAKEIGGVFILQVDTIQYSLAEITRIIESNKSLVLSVSTSKVIDNIDKINITIKVNTLDLTYILASFERYSYTILHVFHQAEQIDQLKERYDALMHYINI